MRMETKKAEILSCLLGGIGSLVLAAATELTTLPGARSEGMVASKITHVNATIPLPNRDTVRRINVSATQAPYAAISHFDLEGQEAASLSFGPSSSQVVITVAHNFNTIVYGPDRHASYSDDRGNKANIVAVYLPKNYDAQDSTHGKYADKAIVVLDRPIPGALNLPFNPIDVEDYMPCNINKKSEDECALIKPFPVEQAGYPADRPYLSANIGGDIDAIDIEPGTSVTFLLHHNLDIIPGDSGSTIWNKTGIIGIVQSTLYATPITQDFVDCYNAVVRQVQMHPPKPQQVVREIQVIRAVM